MTTDAEIRASHLQTAFSGALGVRDTLTGAYAPAVPPPVLSLTVGALLRELVAVKGAVCLDEGADREINLRAAFNGALDVRDLLTRTYEPAALPVGLSLAVAELLREIEKAQIVTAAQGAPKA